MAKSLYQYRVCPEHKQKIEKMFNQIISSPKYKYIPDKKSHVFTCNVQHNVKGKIEYKITADILNICIWKVFNTKSGRTSTHSISSDDYGLTRNNTIENIINVISQKYPLRLLTHCIDVDDNYNIQNNTVIAKGVTNGATAKQRAAQEKEKYSRISLSKYVTLFVDIRRYDFFLSDDDNFYLDIDLLWNAGSHRDGVEGTSKICSLDEIRKNGWDWLHNKLCEREYVKISKESFYEEIVFKYDKYL